MIQRIPLRNLVDRISRRQPFTFSRWGDGEWQSVLGRNRGVNCDGHTYFPEMGLQLRQVLWRRPEYVLGMQKFSLRGTLGRKIIRWLDQHELTDLVWHEADVFHHSAIRGRLEPLIETLRTVPVVIVGPDHLKRLAPSIPYTRFVDVPPKDAFLALDRIYRDCLAAVDGMHENVVVSISAGMPAELLIDRLYDRLGEEHTLIDFGSLWDPFVGVKSRSYMKGN